jgi:hypothetical protein
VEAYDRIKSSMMLLADFLVLLGPPGSASGQKTFYYSFLLSWHIGSPILIAFFTSRVLSLRLVFARRLYT